MKNLPKLSIHQANRLREEYVKGASINSLSKTYNISRVSVKCILKGETYNLHNKHSNLLKKETQSLF